MDDNSYPARFGRLSVQYKMLYRALQLTLASDTLAQAQGHAQWILDNQKETYDQLTAADAETAAWLQERIVARKAKESLSEPQYEQALCVGSLR